MWYIQIIYYAMHDKISSMKKINEPNFYLMDSLNIYFILILSKYKIYLY